MEERALKGKCAKCAKIRRKEDSGWYYSPIATGVGPANEAGELPPTQHRVVCPECYQKADRDEFLLWNPI